MLGHGHKLRDLSLALAILLRVVLVQAPWKVGAVPAMIVDGAAACLLLAAGLPSQGRF